MLATLLSVVLAGTVTFTFKSGETNSVSAGTELHVNPFDNTTNLPTKVVQSISWGDGTTSSAVTLPATHTYATAPSSALVISSTNLTALYKDLVAFGETGTPAFESVSISGILSVCPFALAGHSISSVSLGDVGSVSHDAFRDCLNLTSVVIPATCMGQPNGNPFTGCENLTSITVASGNLAFSDCGKNILFDMRTHDVSGWCKTSVMQETAETFNGKDLFIYAPVQNTMGAEYVGKFRRELSSHTWEGGWPTGDCIKFYIQTSILLRKSDDPLYPDSKSVVPSYDTLVYINMAKDGGQDFSQRAHNHGDYPRHIAPHTADFKYVVIPK